VAVRVAGRARFGPAALLAHQRLIGPPDVAVSSHGRAVVAWSNDAVQVAERSRRGRWSKPRRLSVPGRSLTSEIPAVAADPAGDATVAWSGISGPPGRRPAVIAADRLVRHAWMHPLPVSAAREQDASTAVVALGARRHGVLVWRSLIPRTGFVIWAARRR
jgi:hypothetical protein